MNSKVYKWCAVPECVSSSREFPNKLFIYVPHNKLIREKWLKLARRNPSSVLDNAPIYFCEDHFDLPNDMLNYMEHHVMGAVRLIHMKADCLPSKFECQSDRRNQPIVVMKPTEHSYKHMKKKTPTEMDEPSYSSTLSFPQNQIKVFCPKCKTEVSHTIQQAQTKALVARVYYYLEQEYEHLKIVKSKLAPLSKIRERTALATGVSESTVLEILQEEERRNAIKEPSPEESGVRKRLRQTDSAHEHNYTIEEFKQDAPATSFGQDVSAQVPDIADGVSESTKASTTGVQTITSRKKTNAQKCREYRERKKLQDTKVQNITGQRSDECSEAGQLQAKKPKTNAERRKKHYEAQKLKKQASKKIPKTVKQRNKEYYERKKKRQALNTLYHHSDASRDNCSAKICKHPEEIRHNAEATRTPIEPDVQTLVVKQESVESHDLVPATSQQPQVIYVKALSGERPAVKKVRTKKKCSFVPGAKIKLPIMYVKALDNNPAKINPVTVEVKVEPPNDGTNETQTALVADPLFVKIESGICEDSQTQMNPTSMDVKIEPPDDEMNDGSQLGEVKLEIEIGEEGFS